MMVLIEILALCGIAQIITASYLLAPLRATVPTAHLKYLVSCAQCTGFWVGFIVYAAVACCAIVAPETNFGFPLAEAVAGMHGCIRWGLVFLLGGLISICVILVNHVIETMHFCKMWFVFEIEEHQIARKLLEKELSQKSRKRDND